MSAATKLTSDIIEFIHRQGGFAWRAQSAGVFDVSKGIFRASPKKGVSDVLACHQGRLFAIEVKIGKDRLKPEQEGFLANVRHAGGRCIIATDFVSFQRDWRSESL